MTHIFFIEIENEAKLDGVPLASHMSSHARRAGTERSNVISFSLSWYVKLSFLILLIVNAPFWVSLFEKKWLGKLEKRRHLSPTHERDEHEYFLRKCLLDYALSKRENTAFFGRDCVTDSETPPRPSGCRNNNKEKKANKHKREERPPSLTQPTVVGQPHRPGGSRSGSSSEGPGQRRRRRGPRDRRRGVRLRARVERRGVVGRLGERSQSDALGMGKPVDVELGGAGVLEIAGGGGGGGGCVGGCGAIGRAVSFRCVFVLLLAAGVLVPALFLLVPSRHDGYVSDDPDVLAGKLLGLLRLWVWIAVAAEVWGFVGLVEVARELGARF